MDAKELNEVLKSCYLYRIKLGRGMRECWFPNKEAKVPGSFNIVKPSRRFPHGYIRHVQTLKYKKLLLKYNPELFFKAAFLDETFLEIAPSIEEALIAAVISKMIEF